MKLTLHSSLFLDLIRRASWQLPMLSVSAEFSGPSDDFARNATPAENTMVEDQIQ